MSEPPEVPNQQDVNIHTDCPWVPHPLHAMHGWPPIDLEIHSGAKPMPPGEPKLPH